MLDWGTQYARFDGDPQSPWRRWETEEAVKRRLVTVNAKTMCSEDKYVGEHVKDSHCYIPHLIFLREKQRDGGGSDSAHRWDVTLRGVGSVQRTSFS